MDRPGEIQILVRSIQANLPAALTVLEELNAGKRERTFPRALERAFRAVEHDARVVALERLAEFAMNAKTVAGDVLNAAGRGTVELLAEAAQELRRVGDSLDQGKRHELARPLVDRLAKEAARIEAARHQTFLR